MYEKKQLEERSIAYEIIAQYADADSSYEELVELLIQNDISQSVAENVARDVRS